MQQYYVKSGDTMWKIANRLGIPLSSLIAANPHVVDPNVLNIGDILYLPTSHQVGPPMMGTAAGGYAGPTWQYTVKKGDSLWKIAQRAGIPHATLIAANPQISDPNTIMPGQVINVPGGYHGKAPSQKPPMAPSKSYQAPSQAFPPLQQHPSAAMPPSFQVNIAPPTQINADLNINQINPPNYYGSKSMPQPMPQPMHHGQQHMSEAKLYVQEETTQFVKKKRPPGYVTFCYDPTLPPGVIIQGPPLGDVTNPFIPPSHTGGYKPFYEYGAESASGWKMESKWFKESSS